MGLDMILMKMAICEFTEMPEVPIKVTINEYIELAKMYSSTKSGLFINGLLDKIVITLKEEGKLNKMGRGLIN
jgi:N utilization substance protein B